MEITALQSLDVTGKRVLLREDLNVPMKNGDITNDARLQAALPTVQWLLEQNAAVIIMSHLGRPTEGEFDQTLSLAPVADHLATALQQPVNLAATLDDVVVQPGEVVLLENVRFNIGEKANDSNLAKRYAELCDIFVMDAFATAHREQASTFGVAKFAAQACAGPLLMSEIDALTNAFLNPDKPLLAIVGGAKVSTKLTLLESLLDKVNQLIVGGGLANTFIAASGHNIGKSLVERDLIDVAKQLIDTAQRRGCAIPIPTDVVVTTEFDQNAKAIVKDVSAVTDDEMILDIGPNTARSYNQYIQKAQTIIWNGPVGVFEWPQFSVGTKAVAEAIASSSAFSVAGGGDTVAAIEQFKIQNQVSYISTGGGAFLEFLEGKTLPGLAALMNKG